MEECSPKLFRQEVQEASTRIIRTIRFIQIRKNMRIIRKDKNYQNYGKFQNYRAAIPNMVIQIE